MQSNQRLFLSLSLSLSLLLRYIAYRRVFPTTSHKYGTCTASSRTVTAYYVTTDKFSVSFTRSSLYHCQYRDAELIGRLEGNQFSSSKKLRRLRVTSTGADPRVSPSRISRDQSIHRKFKPSAATLPLRTFTLLFLSLVTDTETTYNKRIRRI